METSLVIPTVWYEVLRSDFSKVSLLVSILFLGAARNFRLSMPRTKFRLLCRSVTDGKRSRNPKEETNASDDAPSGKKLHLDVKGSPSTSKASPSNKKPSGYHFQDVSILQRVVSAGAVCKECVKSSLLLFERPTGCGLERMLILQCANNACRAFTELPTSEKIVCGKQELRHKQEISTGHVYYQKGKS